MAGGALLGPAGLLAGLLLGGRREETTFVAKLKDGRKFLASVDKRAWPKILAAQMTAADVAAKPVFRRANFARRNTPDDPASPGALVPRSGWKLSALLPPESTKGQRKRKRRGHGTQGMAALRFKLGLGSVEARNPVRASANHTFVSVVGFSSWLTHRIGCHRVTVT